MRNQYRMNASLIILQKSEYLGNATKRAVSKIQYTQKLPQKTRFQLELHLPY